MLRSMAACQPGFLAFKKTARCALAAALLAGVGLACAAAAEPREESEFGTNPGNLRMFSYVPAGLAPGAPLIVALHGCKQRAATFARDSGWIAVADRLRAALLLPEQKGLPSYLYDIYLLPGVVKGFGANNQNACFNWFEPEDTTRDRGEAASINQMIDTMTARHPVDRSRIYVVGLSAGGAMTAAMLAAYPERFAGGAIVAGVPYRCADTVFRALRCMDPGVDETPAEWRRRVGDAAGSHIPRVSIWHGDADTRVVPRNRQELVEQWTAVHDIPATPARREQIGVITREVYVDATGGTPVESVLVAGLGHAFPIRTGPPSCGQPGDFVAAVGVCAAEEIARFWGLTGGN